LADAAARADSPPEIPPASEDPWVETRAGGLFFVNAILAAPALMALYPWTLRWIMRTAGVLDRPSRILDPVPAVANHVIPVLGWLAIPAAWLVLRNLRIVDRTWARRALWLFLAVHIGTVVYTVLRVAG
jgi:hypothetical protein